MIKLIYDRTALDVLQGNTKGQYKASDLNRVEQAVEVLSALLPALDLYPVLTVKTDWCPPALFSAQEWPVQSQMDRYLENVRALVRLCGVETALPASMTNLTWQGANQIEAALHSVEERIKAVKNTYPYSGEIQSGEENGL